MGILDISNRKLALCYTHIAYRNTALEDYHSQNVIMDDDFYNIIYEIVSKQIKRIKRNQKILVQINSLEECNTLLQQMYYPRAKEFQEFALEVFRTIQFKNGSQWDPAEVLESKKPKDAAEYILSGHFKECCELHRKLDNATMKYINRDIHNRMYTLITMKYFGENFEQ